MVGGRKRFTAKLNNIMDKRQFARRFSLDDWSLLCSDERFRGLVEDKDWGAAEVEAYRLLAPGFDTIPGKIDKSFTFGTVEWARRMHAEGKTPQRKDWPAGWFPGM